MSDSETTAAPLGDIGIRIIQGFHSITSIWPSRETPRGITFDAILNEKERFELWAMNLGLYQKGHGSLDYRLRDAAGVWSHCENLLIDLGRALDELFTDLYSQASELGAETIHHDDDGSSNSEEDETLAAYNDELTAQSALKSVADCNDYLFKLSMKIRNPSTRTGLSRGYQYRRLDEDTGVDLYDYYSGHAVDEQHILNLFQWCWGYPVDPNYFLVRRLSRANNLRRRQFGYWCQHKVKLSKRAELMTQTVANHDQHGHPNKLPLLSEYSKPTTATQLDPKTIKVMEDGETQSVVSTLSMVLPQESDSSADVLEFPEVPEKYTRRGRLLTEVECPYCFTICSSRVLQWDKWKDKSQLFDSFTDWAAHEAISHPSDSKAADEDAPTKTRVSEVSADLPGLAGQRSRKCPFCGLLVVTGERYYQHAANHLIRVALFTIPRSTGIEEDDGDEFARSDVNTGHDEDLKSDMVVGTDRETLSFDSDPDHLIATSRSDSSGSRPGAEWDFVVTSGGLQGSKHQGLDPYLSDTALFHRTGKPMDERGVIDYSIYPKAGTESQVMVDSSSLTEAPPSPERAKRYDIDDILGDGPGSSTSKPQGTSYREDEVVIINPTSQAPPIGASEAITEVNEIIKLIRRKVLQLIDFYISPNPVPTVIAAFEPRLAFLSARMQKIAAIDLPGCAQLIDRWESVVAEYINIQIDQLLNAAYGITELFRNHYDLSLQDRSPLDEQYKALEYLEQRLFSTVRETVVDVTADAEVRSYKAEDHLINEPNSLCRGAVQMINGRDHGGIALLKSDEMFEKHHETLQSLGGAYLWWTCPECSFRIRYHVKLSAQFSINLTTEFRQTASNTIQYRSSFLAKSHLFRPDGAGQAEQDPSESKSGPPKYGCVLCFAQRSRREKPLFAKASQLAAHLVAAHRDPAPAIPLLEHFRIAYGGKTAEKVSRWEVNFT